MKKSIRAADIDAGAAAKAVSARKGVDVWKVIETVREMEEQFYTPRGNVPSANQAGNHTIDRHERSDSLKETSAQTSLPKVFGDEVREYPRDSGDPPMDATLFFLGFPGDDIVAYFVERTGKSYTDASADLADLLIGIHTTLFVDGITHISDPRVADDVRKVWRVLMDPEILAVLSDDKIAAIVAFDR